jgi:hypothetical protein
VSDIAPVSCPLGHLLRKCCALRHFDIASQHTAAI